MTTRAVVWFRRDLRLNDNPAWATANESAERVTALYVLDPILLRGAGEFRRTQLLAHLHGLDQSLRPYGGRLMVRHGRADAIVPEVVAASGATLVCANADATPYARHRDDVLEDLLGSRFQRWWGNLVHPPGAVLTAKGRTSRVFTPFAAKWNRLPLPTWPESTPADIDDDTGDGLPALDSKPFQPGGEEAAADRLLDFSRRADHYGETRDLPAAEGTSVLSADLRFGTLAPRRVVTTIGTSTEGRAAFVRQLAWRDWYAHLLWELPSMVDSSIRPELDRIRWENDPSDIAAWREGRTGYPFIDAGMRQLARTGWMHNRVRMAAASFLVKDLLVDWRIGERWFRRLLVDADIAQNAGNWQWVAGTGADAAPYFRVFNPVLQSEKHDPGGGYIRAFVPELAGMMAPWIHRPWTAPVGELVAGGVTLGATYPYPIVDHRFARSRAVNAYAEAARAAKDRLRRRTDESPSIDLPWYVGGLASRSEARSRWR
jgi:deoxyribodipyrimidine photo-lyase